MIRRTATTPTPTSTAATTKDGRSPRLRERGATLAEYGMLVALFTIVLIGAAELLTEESGDLLNETGADIAADPAPRDIVLDMPVTPPAGFPPPTTPSTLLTYVDKPIELFDGTCIAVSGPAISSTTCGDPSEALISGLSEDGVNLTFPIGGGFCMLGNSTAVPPSVTPGSCDAVGSVWQQDSVSGTSVVYRHQSSGLCLTVVSPPTPDLLTLAPCDGRPEQTLIVRY